MIRDYHEAGVVEQLHENLLADTLDQQERQSLGAIHPTFMGGEYLPNYGRSEVEIARIELESTTYDVISLRARPVGTRIKYRLVDEYSSEYRLPQQTSSRPLSLGELIRFLDSVEQGDVSEPSWTQFGFVLSSSQCNLECGADLETLRDFTQVESDYYPDLASHYAKRSRNGMMHVWRNSQPRRKSPESESELMFLEQTRQFRIPGQTEGRGETPLVFWAEATGARTY
jgi:hypothetical protein